MPDQSASTISQYNFNVSIFTFRLGRLNHKTRSLARSTLREYNTSKEMKKQLAITLGILLLLLSATVLVILYGRGYRFGIDQGRPAFLGTGLLVTTSKPNGASVFIDGHLATATANTINLAPGQYSVKIFKDGYFAWEKKVKIQKEVVSKIDALLFPTAPKLESLTNIGVGNPIQDPSKTRLAYTVASQSARRNGIYILDLTVRPILTLQSASTQIADDTVDEFSNSTFSFSPDGSELVATTSARPDSARLAQTSYLLDTRSFNTNPRDVTTALSSVAFTYEKQKADKEKARIDSLPKKLRKQITESFKILEWSLDDTKILYQASSSAALPIIIEPRLLGTDTTEERRALEKGQIYVYDIKEDKNYKIDVKSPKNLHWYPDSDHLIFVSDKKIDVMEYDGGNRTTVYAGPFVDSFAYPWPDGSKVVILTDLGNPNIIPNLYTIGLK